MHEPAIAAADLDALAAFDTPTICNALERLRPGPARPWLHDAAVRLRLPAAEADRRLRAHGNDSLGGAAGSFRRGADGRCGTTTTATSTPGRARRSSSSRTSTILRAAARSGARSNRRSTSGSGARGLVTNGSVRDIDQWAPGFQFLAGSIGAVARLREAGRLRRRSPGVRTARARRRHSARRPPRRCRRARRRSCAPSRRLRARSRRARRVSWKSPALRLHSGKAGRGVRELDAIH